MTKENNGWISVKDRLPPYETAVFGLCVVLEMELILIVSREEADGEWYFSPVTSNGVDYENTVEVTHWKPLPPIPTK
ncbi:DUF551 domain-containing protein [Actinobacillus minor]|uniref:DUF551 domain-containing protein n=1 Tax=Actinobacillus minor TaxID=51047 RepID=UPI0023F15BEA|nr:DUF551 domain-containing protein [Actinobacillus minor]MDD6911047.1 DUF551 domain-containing protein [Actinobacillus minor]MDY4714065.1 DUF551 domain-containing protein [Actinobacillus minor]